MKVCKVCGNEYDGNGKNYCSRSCYHKSRVGVKMDLSESAIEARRQNGYANRGRKVNDTVKTKISLSSKKMWAENYEMMYECISKPKIGVPRTDETRLKISEGQKGILRPYVALRNKNNPPHAGHHHSEETRQRISEAVAGAKNGMYGCKPKYGKIYEYVTKSGKLIKFRSSYEHKFAQYLDRNDLQWEYELTTFNLKDRTYTPDFYVYNWDMYIEIKGYPHPISISKYEEFKNIYSNIKSRILYGKDLFEEFKIQL